MIDQEIATVLRDLQETTDRLFPVENRLNLDGVEAAIADRQKVVDRLNTLIEESSDRFTAEDLEFVRRCHFRGKRAYEEMVETRRQGWTTATELAQNEYVLRSFARYGSGPDSSF